MESFIYDVQKPDATLTELKSTECFSDYIRWLFYNPIKENYGEIKKAGSASVNMFKNDFDKALKSIIRHILNYKVSVVKFDYVNGNVDCTSVIDSMSYKTSIDFKHNLSFLEIENPHFLRACFYHSKKTEEYSHYKVMIEYFDKLEKNNEKTYVKNNEKTYVANVYFKHKP
jgi:hypothetical protein